MPPNLESRVEYLEKMLSLLVKPDRYTIQRNLQIFDGINIQTGLNSGTKIGTATDQKLGFYGVTPVTQPARPGSTVGQIITTGTALGLWS